MNKLLLTAAFAAMAMVESQAQTLIAGWDFQTTTNGGTAILATPNTQTSFVANFGTGTLFLNGTNGSSVWAAASELNAFAGTAVNAGTGFSLSTTAPASLALVNQTANTKSIVFAIDMSGYEDLTISYATQRTGTGFTSQTWDYSTDGVNWVNFDTVSGVEIPAAFGTVTLATTAGLDEDATAFVRMTVAGNTSASGNNRLDNIQFNAVAVPEPAVSMLLGSVGMVLLFRRKRSLV